MDGTPVESKIIAILRRTLAIEESMDLPPDTALLGAMPELDSLSLVALITAIENHFGFQIEDDEVGADMFQTISTLSEFVQAKLAEVDVRNCNPSS